MSDRKDLRVKSSDHKWITGKMLTFFVGEEAKRYYVHKDLFQARRTNLSDIAFSHHLREPDPETFDLYVQYIYSGKIPSRADGNTSHDRLVEMAGLLDMWVMVNRLGDVGAKDAVASALLALSPEPTSDGTHGILPGEDQMALVYNNTQTGSPMRRLLVDMYIWSLETTTTDSIFEYFQDATILPRQFLLDLSKVAMEKYAALQDKYGISHGMDQVSCCDYHEHKAYAPCSSKKRKRGDSDDDEDEV